MRGWIVTPIALGIGTVVWARHRARQIAGWGDIDWTPPDWTPEMSEAEQAMRDSIAALRRTGIKLENSNETIYNPHPREQCVSDHCTLHNRSDHHMRAWPQHWRSDRGMMERICPHGVGHPDPDEVHPDTVHGCDGCCATYEELGMTEGMKTEITVIDGRDGFTPEMLRWRKPVVLVDWNAMDGNVIETIYDRGLNKGDTVRLTDFEEDDLDCIGVVVDMREPNNPKAMIGDVLVYTFEVRR